MAKRIEIYDPNDIKLIKSRPTFTNFGSIGEADYVELHVLSGENVLESNYDVEGWSIDTKDTNNSSPSILLNIHEDIRDLGYRSGKFNVLYNFFRKIVGDNINSLIIDEVSKTRKEIRIRLKDPQNMPLAAEFLEWANKEGDNNRIDIEVDFFSEVTLNFGEGVTALAVNWVVDYQVWPEYPYSVVVKLYEPLPEGIEAKDELWIVKSVVDSVIEELDVQYNPPIAQPYLMAPPNFTIPTKYDTASPTAPKSLNDLLDAPDETKNKLISKFFSGSIGDVDINFDFNIKGTDLSNIVHFGKATDRLENFKYKLQQIEYYDASILSLQSATAGNSYQFAQNVSKFKNLKTSIIAGFDDIEHQLYYHSSSYEGTSSYGDYWNLSWPKETGIEPYKLAPSTSSLAMSWLGQITDPGAAHYNTGAMYSASMYDMFNDNSLQRLIPSHVLRDENNDEYSKFVNMIAQHFDYIYFYIKSLLDIHTRDNNIYEGLSKDLIKPVLESLGWYPHQGFDFDDLWTYHLGTNNSGSFGATQINHTADFTQSVTFANNSQTSQSFSREEISKELWKRILNNLPGVMKSKGSEKSIRSLISMYGLPSTILKIYEYGGPQVNPNRKSKVIYDRYSYAIKSTPNDYIKGTWSPASASVGPVRYPDTVEMRFKIPDIPQNKKSMVLWNTYSGSVAIWLEPTASKVSDGLSNTSTNFFQKNVYGRVHFSLRSGSGAASKMISASTDYAPIYDGDWWNVQLSRRDVAKDQDKFAFTGSTKITDHAAQDLRYQLYCKKKSDFSIYGKIPFNLSSSMDVSGSLGEATASFNRAWGGTTGDIIDENDAATLYHYVAGAVGEEAGGGDGFLSVSASGAGQGFSGSLQEFRMWHHHLSESVFESRVNSNRSIEGRSMTSSYHDNLVRWALGNDLNKYNVSHSVQISSSHPALASRFVNGTGTTLTTQGTLYGYPALGKTKGYGEEEERTFTLMPKEIGFSPYSEKIRLEDNSLKNSTLAVDAKYEKSSFDTNPVDSNKLGVFFSPVDEIDLDIAHEFGPYDPDNLVGDPMDTFRPSYLQLGHARDHYFKKHFGNPNFSSYIRLMQYFDDSLFRTIRQLLPARANAQVGLLVKPHKLERPKVLAKPSASMHGYTAVERLEPEPIMGSIGILDSMSFSGYSAGEFGQWRWKGTQYHANSHSAFGPSGSTVMNHQGSREGGFMLVASTSNAAIMKDKFKPLNSREAALGLLNTTVGEIEADMDYTKFGYDHILKGARYIHTTVEFPKKQGSGTDPDGAKVWNAYYERDAWGMTIHTPPHALPHLRAIPSAVINYDDFTASRGSSPTGFVTDGYVKWGLNRRRNAEVYIPFVSQSRKSFDRKIKLNYYASAFSQSKGQPIPESHILSNLVVTYGRQSMQGIALPSHKLTEAAEYQDFKQTPIQNLYWHGCKLVGSDFNMESSDTTDGGPVVEFHEVSPYKYVVAEESGDGRVLTKGEGIGESPVQATRAVNQVGSKYVRPSPTRGTFTKPKAQTLRPTRNIGRTVGESSRGGRRNPGPRSTRGLRMNRGRQS